MSGFSAALTVHLSLAHGSRMVRSRIRRLPEKAILPGKLTAGLDLQDLLQHPSNIRMLCGAPFYR